MLGLYALALLCWQVAVRRGSNPTSDEKLSDMGHPMLGRAWALTGLAVAIAATINAHYFGVLLLVPICAAELVRTVMRRRVDWAAVGAICVGMAGFVGVVPFLKAAGGSRRIITTVGGSSLHDITRAYRSIFVDYTQMSLAVQHVAMVVLVLFAGSRWNAGCGRVVRRREVPVPVVAMSG